MTDLLLARSLRNTPPQRLHGITNRFVCARALGGKARGPFLQGVLNNDVYKVALLSRAAVSVAIYHEAAIFAVLMKVLR